MLKRLVLQNFMAHRNLEINFSAGLNAVRGANEVGKSSMLLGIAYALFGTRALRTTFEEATTWGEPASSLKVTLHLGDHIITRGKSGAEVTLNGKPFVTGQTEVTNFCCNLLGVDSATASKLMFANQGNLRGSLEQGPKATQEFIESLSGMELFEKIIEAMQAKCLLGSDSVLVEVLKQHEDLLAEMPSAVEPVLDTESITKYADFIPIARGYYERDYAIYTDARVETEALKGRQNEWIRIRAGLALASEQRRQHLATQAQANKDAQGMPSDEALAALRDQAGNLSRLKTLQDAKASFQAFTPPSDVWEGSRESFAAEVKATRSSIARNTQALHGYEGTLKAWQSRIVEGDTCHACGQDLKHAPNIQDSNKKAREEIKELEIALISASRQVKEHSAYLAQLEAVEKANAGVESVLRSLNGFVKISEATYPPSFTWSAGPVAAGGNMAEIAKQLRDMENLQKTCHRAEAMSETMANAIRELDSKIVAFEAAEKVTPEVPDEVLAAKSDKDAEILGEAVAHYGHMQAAEEQVRVLRDTYATAKAAWDQATGGRKAAEARVEKAKADLGKLHFNNVLLKKIRLARPIIADKLWNTVLASVSVMFSQMRGVASTVSKGKDGFVVDGQPVASLSGSTLDCLGAAIRTSLVKTFLPNCPFMVMDEPAQGCDPERTERLLAFLLSTGFSQVILATHEDVSEALADSVIQL